MKTVLIRWRALDDTALVRAALARQAGAWNELRRRHHSTVRAAVVGALKTLAPALVSGAEIHGSDGAQTTDDVNDVIGDVYLALLVDDGAMLRAFDPRLGNLASWLHTIAYQTAVEHVRRSEQRLMEVPIDPLVVAADGRDAEEVADEELLLSLVDPFARRAPVAGATQRRRRGRRGGKRRNRAKAKQTTRNGGEG